MSSIGPFPPSLPPARSDEPIPMSREELFESAAALTGSSFQGWPLQVGLDPRDQVMGTISEFSGDPNISDFERGVLYAYVQEMLADGAITEREADGFGNRVEAMTRGLENYLPPG